MTRLGVTGVAVAGLLAAALTAQRGAGRFHSMRDDSAVVAAFAGIVAQADPFAAVVCRDGERVALGTIADASGLVVTKASELGDGSALTCVIGREALAASLVGVDALDDLALLRLDGAEGLAAPVWADSPPSRGAWLVSIDGDGTPAGIGVLSSAPYRHSADRGYLGVELVAGSSPVRLKTVQDGTAAELAGLEGGDEVLALDGEVIATSTEFIRGIQSREPGDRVSLRVKRGSDELELTATLLRDRRGERSSQERLWGPLSAVRAGFGTVLQHDTILTPDSCGGPLVDLDGLIVGVNIARAGRIESLALPADEVRAAVARIVAAGRGRDG